MKEIRRAAKLSISELAHVLRYNDVRGLRRMEDGDQDVTGPVSVVMKLIDMGYLSVIREAAIEIG